MTRSLTQFTLTHCTLLNHNNFATNVSINEGCADA
jgi:hypothetical protein